MANTRNPAASPAAGATIGGKEFLMFGRLGLPEIIIILFIIILIFGANRLPEIGRGIGKGIRNFKDATKEGTRKDEV
jgi:sec-independent protein translocase protein TatA